MGYRLIDTAACYGNEKAVWPKQSKKSQIPREDIFISSKVWIQDAGYQKTNNHLLNIRKFANRLFRFISYSYAF